MQTNFNLDPTKAIIIAEFEIKDKSYYHALFTNDGDFLNLYEYDSNIPILTYTANSYIVRNGEIIGRLNHGDKNIHFDILNKKNIDSGCSLADFECYLKAEVVISKLYLNGEL